MNDVTHFQFATSTSTSALLRWNTWLLEIAVKDKDEKSRIQRNYGLKILQHRIYTLLMLNQSITVTNKLSERAFTTNIQGVKT
ncbi:hypothetical protein CSV77_14155 [Sporosarcina sp. P16b]|nr:hypothetical protein CSV77_14155 [Sporosarcina sp. P16b]